MSAQLFPQQPAPRMSDSVSILLRFVLGMAIHWNENYADKYGFRFSVEVKGGAS
jgi:hypothetical protein